MDTLEQSELAREAMTWVKDRNFAISPFSIVRALDEMGCINHKSAQLSLEQKRPTRPCSLCDGSGKSYDSTSGVCLACHGSGRIG